MKKFIGFIIVAMAGAGLIYVPHEMFYDPEIFFAIYID